MIEIKNDIIIKCNKCGKIINIDKDDLFYETHEYERNMGSEIETIFYGDVECDCNNLIRLNLTEDLDTLAYQVIDTIIDDYFASRNPDFILFFRKDIKKVLENQEKKYK